MKIDIYPCPYFKGVYCPYCAGENNNQCNQEIKTCSKYRKEIFPEMEKRTKREEAIARSKLKKLKKITLEIIITNHTSKTL